MQKILSPRHAASPLMKIIAFITVFSMFTHPTPAFAQTAKTRIDAFLDRLAEKNKAMGSVTLANDSGILYTRAIGYSQINGTEMKPLTTANRFRIGSVTKMFTAAMIFQLAEEKKLKLTETIDRFFPQIPNAGKITFLHILGHRSGIPNIKRIQNAQGNINTMPMTKEEMLSLIVNAQPDFEPGTQHAYSNSAYLVLGLILEKVSGKPYAEMLKERITRPLGLKDTYMATGNIDMHKNEALTYMRLGNEWKPMPETHPGILFSAGAIISTPDDLVRFIQALFNGKIISKENLDRMKTMTEGEGMGMEPFTFAGKTFYGHTGGADNYGAWLAYLPEEKLAFAYTTNAKVYPVGNIVSGIIDLYYGKPFQIPAFETVTVSPEILDQYVGVYTTPDAPVKFTITRKENILYIQPGRETAAPLEAVTAQQFKIEGAITVSFDIEKNQMILKRNGGQRIFTKEK